MPDLLIVGLLLRSVKEFNETRKADPLLLIDLSGAKLVGANLRGANLKDADIRGADLAGATSATRT